MMKEYMHIKAINLSDDEEEYEDTIDEEPQDTATQQEKTEGSKQSTKTPTINRFSIDLTKAAEEGKLDPVVGREKEIQRLQEILCRRKKNNPILIGEPGVGKSAIVEGLAQMIADKKVSPILHNKRLVGLDMAGMVAGTK
jgi:ATP-dependent Clp protease ATP-binding subunit ClpC